MVVDRQGLVENIDWYALRIETVAPVESWYQAFVELMDAPYHEIADRMWASGDYELRNDYMPEWAYPDPGPSDITPVPGGVSVEMGGGAHPNIVLDALIEGLAQIGLTDCRISKDRSNAFDPLVASRDESVQIIGWMATAAPEPRVPRQMPPSWCQRLADWVTRGESDLVRVEGPAATFTCAATKTASWLELPNRLRLPEPISVMTPADVNAPGFRIAARVPIGSDSNVAGVLAAISCRNSADTLDHDMATVVEFMESFGNEIAYGFAAPMAIRAIMSGHVFSGYVDSTGSPEHEGHLPRTAHFIDTMTFDAFPYQILTNRHDVEINHPSATVTDLGHGQRAVRIGEINQWIPPRTTSTERPQQLPIVQTARELLAPIIPFDSIYELWRDLPIDLP